MKILRKQYYLQLQGQEITLPALSLSISQGLTWSGWLRPHSTQQEGTMGLWQPRKGGYGLHWHQEAISLMVGKHRVSSEVRYAVNQWVFVSVVLRPTKEGLHVEFYHNAQLAGSAVVPHSLPEDAAEVHLGKGFVGDIATLGWWQEARSTWQLLKDLGGMHRRTDKALLALWSMEEGSGSRLAAKGKLESHGQLPANATWHPAGHSIFIRPPREALRLRTIPLRKVALKEQSQDTQAPTTLPDSGYNGEATKFLSRTDAWVANLEAGAQDDADDAVAQARLAADVRVQQAQREASSLFNSGRFNRLYFISDGCIWYATAEGEVAMYQDDDYPDGFPATDLAVDAGAALMFAVVNQPDKAKLYQLSLHEGVLNAERMYTQHNDIMTSVAVDPKQKNVFCMTGSGKILSTPYTSVGKDPVKFYTPGNGPKKEGLWQLAVDSTHGTVYWTDDFSIWKKDPAGSAAERVVSNHDSPYPYDLLVNEEERALYWVDKELEQVCTCPLEGDQRVVSLYPVLQPRLGMALDFVAPDLADRLEREVYWVGRDTRIVGQTPGIVGAWPLDAGEGTEITNRVHPLDAEPLGVPRQSLDLPNHLMGSAFGFRFRGSDFAQVPNRYTEALTQHSFTITMWIKPDRVTDEGIQALMAAGVIEQPNQTLHLRIRKGTAHMGFWKNHVYGNIRILSRQWTHLAFRYTYDPTTKTGQQAIFVNGVLDNTHEASEPLTIHPEKNMFLGVFQGHDGAQSYAGLLADLRIIPQAIEDLGIRELMNVPTANALMDQVVAQPAWARQATPPTLVPKAASLAFNGLSQYQSLGTIRQLRLLRSSYTLEMWIRPNQQALEESTLLGTFAPSETGALRLYLKDQKLSFRYQKHTYTAKAAISADAWTHVAVSYSVAEGKVSFYLNGQPDSEHSASFTGQEANDTPVFLGREEQQASYQGLMSEVRLWSVVRSAKAISQNYRQYQETFVMRGAISGNGIVERLFKVPAEGGLALVSKTEHAYAARTQAQRTKQENQAQATEMVQRATAAKTEQIQAKTNELDTTHTIGQQNISAQRIRQRNARQANQNAIAQAQADANQTIDRATDTAARNLADARQQAQQVVSDANRRADQMKRDARNQRDSAQADVNDKKAQL